ncbi:MAG TPA: glycoside hydrolase family 3 N-terminal domain-containing protein [Herpetosiphonaceae bacterium]
MIAQPPRQRRPILRQRLLNLAILLFVVLALIMVPRLREATGQTTTPIYKDPAAPIPNRVADLLSRMTLDEKIGQMTQPDRGSLTTESDIATYYLGSILSGGGSAPSPNTPTAWADMYDRYQRIALSTRLGIPMIYGIDAVHGHNNVYGATIFPHNIGLGATRNPALIQQVGRATAEEVAGTGIDWTFAPCLCVARNERWGRTYESYGEDPEIARAMTTIVTGLQGSSLNQPGSILATAKHWVGDGGTTAGDDQGNTQISEAELRRLHIPPYVDAIGKGVGSVMISYSSWNGQKLHGHKYLITDVLKGELGFSGFVVSDWAGIDQLPGDYPSDVRSSINAGIDMVMVPHNYQLFTSTLRSEVNAGTVPLSRIDDAVRRILTKKFELGLFEQPLTDRSYTATIGSAAHRAIARDAVRQSLVLLKNTNNILPLSKSARIFVAGKNADDIGNQSGGWTISWQGGSGNTTPGTTILQGIRNTVAPGTTVTYNKGGRGAAGHDVAVVVIGEKPYAEGQGDAPSYLGLDQDDKNTLNTVKRSGVPMVVVMVSGRPQIISSEIGSWQGLIAAWLPGTEGQGVADVLFGDYRPTGKLPHSWPRSEAQIPINVGDAAYDPLFPYGFGLTYPVAQTSLPLTASE